MIDRLTGESTIETTPDEGGESSEEEADGETADLATWVLE